jgi:hypothetical protein
VCLGAAPGTNTITAAFRRCPDAHVIPGFHAFLNNILARMIPEQTSAAGASAKDSDRDAKGSVRNT